MELANADLWLLIIMKKGELTFEDIKRAIDGIDKSIAEVFEVKLPRPLTKTKFRYGVKDRHALYHSILEDLDSLCSRGEALRFFESDERGEITEKFKITPQGALKAAQLLV